MKRLVLVGGGHAHVEVLRRFGREPAPEVELVLVSPQRFTSYSGMLPGLVAGHYRFEEAHIDLEGLCRFARATFLPDWASGLNLAERQVLRAQGSALAYDLLSLDVGSAAPAHPLHRGELPGIPVKPVDRFLPAWDKVLAEAQLRPLDLVTVGGGAGGVEITLAMQHRLRRDVPGAACRFTLVTDSTTILPGHSASVRARFERVLAARDIEARTGSNVVGYDGDLLLENGKRVPAGRVIWATGPEPPDWLASSGLRTDSAGFMLVDDTLRAVAHPGVFAAGDMATMVNHPRPKSGVFAVRQGPYLAHNLRQALTDAPLRAYLPQSEALALISTGDKYAIASRGQWSLEGAWVWRWKDWIDRRFMRRYSRLAA